MVGDEGFERKCCEIEESEVDERELIDADLREHGVAPCRFDSLPCNMIFSTVEKHVCCSPHDKKRSVGCVWYCGRIWFKGALPWGGPLDEKVQHQNVLDVCRGQSSKTCFFDKKPCESGVSTKAFPNGCAGHLSFGRDRSGCARSSWYCTRIQFRGGMSVGEKVRSQRIWSEDRGGIDE